jgi:hypothetical protein
VCTRLSEIDRLLRRVLVTRFLSSVDHRFGSMAPWSRVLVGLWLPSFEEWAVVRPIADLALRGRHAIAAIVGEESLNGLAKSLV